MMKTVHKPVLLKEVINYLDVQPNRNYIDGTIGGGGHAEAILQNNAPRGLLLGLDADQQAIARTGQRLQKYGSRVILQNKNYKQIKEITHAIPNSFSAHGILLDLGLSSDQLENGARGFSFADSKPLDMRFDQSQEMTADQVIKTWPVEKLEKIFREYGEIRQARKLAGAIVHFRPNYINSELSAADFAAEVAKVIPRGKSKIHPATQVFQALRIAVNDELEGLRNFLPQALDILDAGGRLVIISFHSLEDRIVKNFFKEESLDCICPPEIPVCRCNHHARLKILTKKPIRASLQELQDNPRSRSALLRAAEVL